jgi:hypothetical protein
MRKQHRWWWRKQRKNLVPTENPSSRRKQRHRRPRRPRPHLHRQGLRHLLRHLLRLRAPRRLRLRQHHRVRHHRRLRQHRRDPHLPRRRLHPHRQPRRSLRLRHPPQRRRRSNSANGKELAPRPGRHRPRLLHRKSNPRRQRRPQGSRRSSSGSEKELGPRPGRRPLNPRPRHHLPVPRRPQVGRTTQCRPLQSRRTPHLRQPHPAANRAQRLRERLRWCAARRRQ